ncbi:hypothetical protein BDW72DRAFT_178201 [Aspergillus terricola var. indicus]
MFWSYRLWPRTGKAKELSLTRQYPLWRSRGNRPLVWVQVCQSSPLRAGKRRSSLRSASVPEMSLGLISSVLLLGFGSDTALVCCGEDRFESDLQLLLSESSPHFFFLDT